MWTHKGMGGLAISPILIKYQQKMLMKQKKCEEL